MGTALIIISGLGIFFSIGVFIVSLVSKIIFLIAKKEEKKKKANKVVMISLTVLVQEQNQINNIINKLSAVENVIVAHRK